ncbi:hypothetical protein PR048_014914 [Dryococelus australis]|uniref:Uncharacterized protein n=1 Tax=Dryococelus australis TaxID=614101 RepID=A0ABQ9HFQ9_9NEOP|nr:hypothetical protein PR048_014914 [Dryococelus australis]
MASHSTVENRGFTELINNLEPRFTMPSQKTLSNEIIPTMYNSAVKNDKSQLLETDLVAITRDLWTSVANTDFLTPVSWCCAFPRRELKTFSNFSLLYCINRDSGKKWWWLYKIMPETLLLA